MSEKLKEIKKVQTTGIVLIILIVIVAGFTVLKILGDNAPITGSPGSRPGMPGAGLGAEESIAYSVIAVPLEVSTIQDYLKFNGDVIAETSVDIYPDTAGELTRLNVSLGSYVRKGQVIAEVDPSLPGQVFIASPVKSTITGTITDLPNDVGDKIASSQMPVATVGDLTDLQLVSYISEKNMAFIELGQKGEVHFEPFQGETFAVTVSEISPVLDRSSRTLKIKLTLDNRDDRIKSGMFGSIKLRTQVKNGVIVVPNESIITSAEGSFVYLAENGSVARQHFVETGLIVDGLTEIVSGLSKGDVLISRGQTMLKDGSAIRIAE